MSNRHGTIEIVFSKDLFDSVEKITFPALSTISKKKVTLHLCFFYAKFLLFPNQDETLVPHNTVINILVNEKRLLQDPIYIYNQ